MQDKYDPVLLGILQNEGEIVKFLDVMFSFLYRRTDFYMKLMLPTDKMGFRSGVTKKLVLAAFNKFEIQAAEKAKVLQSLQKQETAKYEACLAASCSSPVAMEVPHAAVEEEVICSENPPTETTESSLAISNNPQNPPTNEEMKEDLSEKSTDSTTSNEPPCNQGKENLGDDVDPEVARMQKIFQANPESYNGAIRDNYSWSQSITDVDVRVKVSKNISKGKDVKVEIAKKRLKVSYKDEHGDMVQVVDGTLLWDVTKDDSIWSLVPGDHIYINLEKMEERWWDALLMDEPKISVRKIDPSRPITDLDDEAQAKIEELMYNEQQKRLGLPQSHEKKVHEMLKNAWDAEGSPFKRQPFDTSKINISPSS